MSTGLDAEATLEHYARAGRTTLRTVAVVLSGGSGTRVGLGLPKQLLKISGKTILEHTLDSLHRSDLIDEVVLVAGSLHLDQTAQIVGDRYPKVSQLVVGGGTRNESTLRAIKALGTEECKVLFHDAVRPFVDVETISRCVEALDHFDAVDVVVESPDTIVVVDDSGQLVDIPDRRTLRRGQTPQGFLLSIITRAYELAAGDSGFAATDDCAVVLRYLPEAKIQTVSGTAHNMKITYPLDMFIADRLFQHMSSAPPTSSDDSAYCDTLTGQTAVVFGGSYGIGFELVELMRGWGANVFAFSRSGTGTDIRNARAVREALQSAHAQTHRIDYVINTAAVLSRGALVDMSVEGVADQIETNLLAPAFIAQAAFPFLKDTRGQLLLFTSSSYTRGRAEYALYSSAKAAVVNLTQALADEWSASQIRVNCLNPERTQTPMRYQSFGHEPADTLLCPRDVAKTAVDTLLSRMTGQIFDVRRDGPPLFDRRPTRATAGRGGM